MGLPRIQVIKMRSNYVIGLNSGTSFDGIDVALVKFKKNDLRPIFVDGIVCEYPKKIKEQIRELIASAGSIHNLSPQKISKLDISLGNLFANTALQIIKKRGLKKEDILLIGSHGQTIYHKPRVKSVQIGNGKIIAKRTDIKTINDFREADIKAGGEGAPLMPFLDQVCFGKTKKGIITLNIGGIANITATGKNIKPIAFDTGPGNALIDLVTRKYFNTDFDRDGLIAKKGNVIFKYIKKAALDPYFRISPPKSTGKEYFNQQFIDRYFSQIKKKRDLISTLTFFTAYTIKYSLEKYVFRKHKISEIVISGGGLKNKTLVSFLKKILPRINITSSDKYGLPSKYKEAILFALLGYTCLKQIPNNIPSCTGARKKTVTGKICVGI